MQLGNSSYQVVYKLNDKLKIFTIDFIMAVFMHIFVWLRLMKGSVRKLFIFKEIQFLCWVKQWKFSCTSCVEKYTFIKNPVFYCRIDVEKMVCYHLHSMKGNKFGEYTQVLKLCVKMIEDFKELITWLFLFYIQLEFN